MIACASEKTCFKCGELKPLSEFYAHAQMADGHLNKCKDCAKKDVRERYDSDKEKIAAYERARFKTAHRKAKVADYQRRRRKRHPDKNSARAAVKHAVRTGKLARLPCMFCGSLFTEAHHDDYSKPLEVKWACFQCHRENFHGQKCL